MTDEQIKEAARRLGAIEYHQREIETHERSIAGHEAEIAKERAAIDALRGKVLEVEVAICRCSPMVRGFGDTCANCGATQ